MEKISVVIPVFQDSHTIHGCLESILKSTYRNLEVIVVSSGPSTITESDFENYGSEFSFVNSDLDQFEDLCNFGLNKSSGEFISFFKVDDINGKMRFELSVKRLEEDPYVGMVFCGTTFIDENGSFLSGISRFPGFSRKKFQGKMFEHNWIPTISSTMFRTRMVESIGGFDKSMIRASDYDLILRASGQAKVEYIDLPLVRYRLSADGNDSETELIKKYEIMAIRKHEPGEIASSLSSLYDKEEDFRISFGKILYKIGLKAEALQQFDRVKSLNSDHSESLFFLGNCYFDLGDFNNSLKSYNACLKIDPQHVGCRNNLGILYYYKGDFESSIREFKKANKDNGELFEPKYNLSCVKKNSSPDLVQFSFIHSDLRGTAQNGKSVQQETRKAVSIRQTI